MGTSICLLVISQMINFFVVCCFVNPGSDPGSDPSSDPGSDPSLDPGFILSLSRYICVTICLMFQIIDIGSLLLPISRPGLFLD